MKEKIPIHGMFIFGLDTDTEESIKETIDFAKSSGITTVQFLILVPLPGTRTYKELKDSRRIFFEDWALYDGHHVTFWPQNIEPLKLQELQIKGHREFYSMGRLLKKFMACRFTDAAIYVYARHINHLWKKSNQFFIKSLNFLEKTPELAKIMTPAIRVH